MRTSHNVKAAGQVMFTRAQVELELGLALFQPIAYSENQYIAKRNVPVSYRHARKVA